MIVWSLVPRRAHIAVRRIRLVGHSEQPIYDAGSDVSTTFASRSDAVEHACRVSRGRRLLVERANGTFAPARCARSR